LGEVEKERESKIEAENMSASLAMEVGQHRAWVQALEVEASWQSEKARKMLEQVNGKGLASPLEPAVGFLMQLSCVFGRS
jgi:hypothetical protein